MHLREIISGVFCLTLHSLKLLGKKRLRTRLRQAFNVRSKPKPVEKCTCSFPKQNSSNCLGKSLSAGSFGNILQAEKLELLRVFSNILRQTNIFIKSEYSK